MGKLTELIARLEGADGGDREVDCHLWAMAEGIDLEWQGTSLVAGTEGVIAWVDPGKLSRNFWSNRATTGPGSIPAYTTSLDAIVALIERKLPGWSWGVSGALSPTCTGLLYEPAPTATGYRTKRRADGKTPALALCIAFLTALKAQQEKMSDVQAAAERLAVVADKPAHLLRWGEGDRNDLKALLSAHQEAREALRPFADACNSADEGTVDNHAHCWESAMAMSVTYGDFRRAAEVYRALFPGGARDE